MSKKAKGASKAAVKAEPEEREAYCFCKDAFLEECPPHLGIHVACDQCKRWFHSECCGYTREEADSVTFLCQRHKEMEAKAKKKASASTIGKKRDRAKDSESAQSKKRRKTASSDAWKGYVTIGPNQKVDLLGTVVLGAGAAAGAAVQVHELKPIGRMDSEAWWEYAEKLHSQARSRVVCALAVQTEDKGKREAFRELMDQQHRDQRILVMDVHEAADAVVEIYLAPVKPSDEVAVVYRKALSQSTLDSDALQYLLLFAVKRQA